MERYTPHAQSSNLLLEPICLVVGVYYGGLVPFLSCDGGEGRTREVVDVWTLSRHTSVLVGGYCTTSLSVWLYCCIHEHNSLPCPAFAWKGGCCSGGCGVTLCWFRCTDAVSRLRARGWVWYPCDISSKSRTISCHGCDSYTLSSLS